MSEHIVEYVPRRSVFEMLLDMKLTMAIEYGVVIKQIALGAEVYDALETELRDSGMLQCMLAPDTGGIKVDGITVERVNARRE